MNQFYGKSASGNLQEAVRGLSNPQLIILMSNADQFEAHVAELESLFPGVPSIGAIGMSYDGNCVNENGVGVTAFYGGVTAIANVLPYASTMPVRYIKRLSQDIDTINPGKDNTVCIDLCSGNDAAVISTMNNILVNNNICMMGGTGDQGKISTNGTVYEDAVAYALIKNNNGKVKTYKENIYRPVEGLRFIASDTDKSKYYIGKLNGKPAKQVYMESCGISESEFGNQTFKNPLGKFNGSDICIVSIKETSGSGFVCFRQVNDSDVLTLLELKDIPTIVEETLSNIRNDFGKPSAVFSVNCLFRYLLFTENKIMDDYLRNMAQIGNHCGYVGYGEHYNGQFVNQSMTCVVFE